MPAGDGFGPAYIAARELDVARQDAEYSAETEAAARLRELAEAQRQLVEGAREQRDLRARILYHSAVRRMLERRPEVVAALRADGSVPDELFESR
jgi:hypothetical protein